MRPLMPRERDQQPNRQGSPEKLNHNTKHTRDQQRPPNQQGKQHNPSQAPQSRSSQARRMTPVTPPRIVVKPQRPSLLLNPREPQRSPRLPYHDRFASAQA